MSSESQPPLFLQVYLPTFILAFCHGMLIPVLPIYARTFEASYTLIGIILASDGIGTLLGDLPAGILIRKLGRKRVMMIGILFEVLSVLALFWAESIFQVVATRLVTGFGNALWRISRHAYLTDITLPYRRGRAIAVFGGVNRIGSFAGPAVGGALAVAFNLRTPFFVYACLAALAMIASAIFVEGVDGDVTTAPPSKAQSFRLLDIVRAQFRQLTTAGTGQLLAQMTRSARPIIIPLYGAEVIGLDVQSLGWILSISSFVDMSMFYPAGQIMDRYGRKYAIVPSFLIQVAGTAAIAQTDSFLGLLAVTSTIGLGNGLGSGTMMTLGADLAPRASMAEFLGIWRLIGDVGHVGCPLVVGKLADILNLGAAAIAMSVTGLLAAGVFAFLVPETLKERSQTADKIQRTSHDITE